MLSHSHNVIYCHVSDITAKLIAHSPHSVASSTNLLNSKGQLREGC